MTDSHTIIRERGLKLNRIKVGSGRIRMEAFEVERKRGGCYFLYRPGSDAVMVKGGIVVIMEAMELDYAVREIQASAAGGDRAINFLKPTIEAMLRNHGTVEGQDLRQQLRNLVHLLQVALGSRGGVDDIHESLSSLPLWK